MVDAGRIDEADIVLRERHFRQRLEPDAVLFRVQADRRMDGAGKAVEKAGLDAAGGEQLAHVFQCIDRVLHGLRRETVHQVGMHQDAGLGEGMRDARHLRHRDALLHQL